ncbi:hypothetical protein MRX96_028326 [Rhipicephalus microplus]
MSACVGIVQELGADEPVPAELPRSWPPTTGPGCRDCRPTRSRCKADGAGGGGCALLLCRVGCQNSMGSSGGPELHAVCKQLEEEGFLYWEVDLGCPGVTLD